LVAGKGHETYQIVGAQTRHFDDREAVRAALEARAARTALTPEPTR
jgi:UDP-N-acetylmuramoyl-L-alanyl-D-glutamate--2,6-diaminopimelate ligase